MAIFFSGDCHHSHSNILKYEPLARVNDDGLPFRSVEHMNEHLIYKWNWRVKPEDTVYVLGDFSFKLQVTTAILSRLNGTKILIVGNHDPFFKVNQNNPHAEAEQYQKALSAGYLDMHKELILEIGGIGTVKLNHFPYAPPKDAPAHDLRHMQHRPKPEGEKALLHGHVHSKWKCQTWAGYPPEINVGVDVWQMGVVSEQEIVELYQSLSAIQRKI